MKMQDEISAGLDVLRDIVSASGKLRLKRAVRFGTRPAYHIVAARSPLDDAEADIQVSAEFLKDLPNHEEYQAAGRTYYLSLGKRMQYGHPYHFYCRSRVPIWIEIYWPTEGVPNQAASFLHIYVYDLRGKVSLAKCSLTITSLQDHFDLKRNPFERE